MIYIFVISNRASRNLSKSASKNVRPTPSFERSGPVHYSSLPRSSGPRGVTLRTFLLRSATQLIRTLAFLDRHLFSIVHIARLPALRAARRVPACASRSALSAGASSRRACLLRAPSRLLALVELFSDLVQRAFQVFSSGAQFRYAALVDGFLRLFDGRLRGLHVGFTELLAILANHLFRLIQNAVQAIARLDLFHTSAIILGVRFRLHAHLLGFFLGQAARSGDGDLLLLVGRFVLGADVQDAVRVDVKSDFDLRRPAGRWRNSIQLEFAKRTVVVRKFAFALHDVNLHAWLVVRRRGISLHFARRDRSVARNLHGHYSAQSFHAQRKRCDVQQQDVFHVSSQHRALNRGSPRHDLVRIHALVQFFSAEEGAHQLLHLRNAR